MKTNETIHRVHGYDHNAYTYYPVLIVGAGASGIAMACRLKQELGFDQFRVFDRQSGIGGTWWINRYPGVACDVPALFYSFSFAQNSKWTSFHPPGREIVQYYHDVCQKFQITDKIQCDTDVELCRWLEDEQQWEVTLRRLHSGMGDLSSKDRKKIIQEKGESAVYADREIVRAKIVISGVGGLVEPKGWPDEIPGVENFKGRMFHSARWDESVDFTDKNVVVIGTGCSSAQLVPRLPHAPYNAKQVTQLMRSPPWVCPSFPAPGGDDYWEKNGPKLMTYVPGLRAALRFSVAAGAEWDFRLFGGSEWAAKHRKQYEEKILRRMRRIVPEKYHEILTPNYGVGCKRRIYDKLWLQSLNDSRVELTTQPLKAVKEKSVVIGPGVLYPENAKAEAPEREVPADIIVLANGFDTTRWLHPLKVVGKQGNDLVQEMEKRGGAQAYQGTAMDGFPNFFMIFGPNTATGHTSVVLASENMVNYSLKFVKLILSGEVSKVDVKHDAEVKFTAQIQKDLKNMVWMQGGCNSWYYTNDGWNSTVYPYTQIDFWRRCTFANWNDWNITYTKKGVNKQRMRRVLRLIALTLVLVAANRARMQGKQLGDVPGIVRGVLGEAFGKLGQVVVRAWAAGKASIPSF
jgi:cation diffusion facilitator CzcD-associated flavoprotein CzcO